MQNDIVIRKAQTLQAADLGKRVVFVDPADGETKERELLGLLLVQINVITLMLLDEGFNDRSHSWTVDVDPNALIVVNRTNQNLL